MKVWPLALLVLLPGPARAQEGSVLPLGVRVRVSTPEGRVALCGANACEASLRDFTGVAVGVLGLALSLPIRFP